MVFTKFKCTVGNQLVTDRSPHYLGVPALDNNGISSYEITHVLLCNKFESLKYPYVLTNLGGCYVSGGATYTSIQDGCDLTDISIVEST